MKGGVFARIGDGGYRQAPAAAISLSGRKIDEFRCQRGGAREEKWQTAGASQEAKACHKASTRTPGISGGEKTPAWMPVAPLAASYSTQE